MTKDPGKGLLAIIAKVKNGRHSENVDQLTDAELIARMSEGLGGLCDNADAQKLIACGWAIELRLNDPAGAAELLQQLGIDDFDPDVLATIHRSPILHEMSTAESYKEFHSCNWQDPDAQTLSYIQKMTALACRIGALALGYEGEEAVAR
jgi:hypothetical protein